jgi:class 3 adenylate cyclase
LRREWNQQLGIVLGLGIGIDQGMVVVGNVGAETRMTFRMVGEAVNIAHRLVDLAEDGQIIIAESIHRDIANTAPHLLETIPFQSMGEIALRGKEKPMVLYRGLVERQEL